MSFLSIVWMWRQGLDSERVVTVTLRNLSSVWQKDRACLKTWLEKEGLLSLISLLETAGIWVNAFRWKGYQLADSRKACIERSERGAMCYLHLYLSILHGTRKIKHFHSHPPPKALRDPFLLYTLEWGSTNKDSKQWMKSILGNERSGCIPFLSMCPCDK